MDSVVQVLTGNRPMQAVALATTILLFFATFVAYKAFFPIHYPRELPRLGADKGISWKDMRKKFHDDCIAVFQDAYENYSKKGKSVLIPVFGPHDEVILPPSSLQWLTRQPDSVVSSLDAQVDSIQLQHSLGYKFAYDPWGGMLIKSDLNAALETVCRIMNDEVGAAIDATFGMDTEEWKELDLFPACRTIGGRATLRFTLGDSPEGRRLCQDKTFLTSCYGALDGMLDVAGAVAATRKVLRPLFSRWASRIMPPKLNDLKAHFKPLYNERLELIQREMQGKKDSDVPEDLLQMMFRYASKERQQEMHNIDDMTRRLAVSNFGTLHQTMLTLHNIILNIVGSDAEFGTIDALREELVRVMGSADSKNWNWTRSKAASMTRADSVARETLRVNSFIGRTVQRLVIAPRGIVTEDGIHLPQGTMVSILAHQAQTDPKVMEDSEKYDPFRASRQREAAADPATNRPGLNHMSFASTGSDYLPFSHGRHACPGRFLVDFELKMIMAYAVMNYDFEFPQSYEGKRPANVWFVGFGIPPMEAKIRVRRRRKST